MHVWAWLRSWRFLLSRRWVLFALAVVVVGYATWWLGEWQFGRLEDRRDRNAVVRANEDRAPVPVDQVLSPGSEVAPEDEWRVITATGTYDPADTIVVRYRTRDSAPGVDVVVPLVTADGTALLVDRGWMSTDNRGITAADVPDPPTGEVTITGWVRANGTGDSTAVEDQSTRAISSDAIGPALGRDVYGGFVDLRSEDPAPADPLARTELPELDDGPHFFYGLQWWFFGALALGGFLYLAWDERTHGRRSSRRRPGRTTPAPEHDRSAPSDPRPGSEGAQQSAVDGQHGAGHERRGW